MSRVLFDTNVSNALRTLLNFDVTLAREKGKTRLTNGDLLAAAEREGFDVLVTADKNMRYQ